MKILGNILWHIPFLGFVLAIAVYVLGMLFTFTIIGDPLGRGLRQLGLFLFLPFGNSIINKREVQTNTNAIWKVYTALIWLLYIPFGLFFALVAICQVIALFCTIIGIPAAIVVAKTIGTFINPVDKLCVPSMVAEEVEKENVQKTLDALRNN